MKMPKLKKHNKKRLGWYLFGFLLFYGPFAIFNRLLAWVVSDQTKTDIHDLCLRMPIANLFTERTFIFDIWSTRSLAIILLIVSAFIVGPFFCGKLCAPGAFTEYLSKLVPERLKIDWYKWINPVPVRYGFLAGFLITPFLTGSIACSYCNYGYFQDLTNGGFIGKWTHLGTTTIITALLWLFIFGIFSKGGRGYCSFLCPVGSFQSLIHNIGSRFGFTHKLKYDSRKCISCNSCVRSCPMGTIKAEVKGVSYDINNCITCQSCEASCPVNAISFGKGERWEKGDLPMPAKKESIS